MSDTLDKSLSSLNDCGCCAGITAETPAAVSNREGLDQIQYRVGTHGSFKRTMLAELSRADHPKLKQLTTRADDDFAVALLDGWAATADVLTFYQERLANEFFLRTATEQGSVLRLARLIGYELKPGVAASAWLAFALETAPGAPGKATISTGAKVQSVPGQDEKPQTFETIETLETHAEWNAMRPQQSEAPNFGAGARELYLRGTATQRQRGDAILIVGDERTGSTTYPDSERWDVRELLSVTPEPSQNRTRVTWEQGLGKPPVPPAAMNVKVYAFRQRAALFGHNAPDPSLLTKPGGGAIGSWSGFHISGDIIDLDSSYSKIVAESWLALTKPPATASDRSYVELYRAVQVSHPSRAAFGLSGKITRIRPDTTEHLEQDFFPLRDTLVFAQSELLEVASPPLTTRFAGAPSEAMSLDAGVLAPVEGTQIALDREVAAIEKGRAVIVTGRLLRARVSSNPGTLLLTADNGTQSAPLNAGESLVVLVSPAVQPGNQVTLRLRREDGFAGLITAGLDKFVLTAAEEADELVSEVVTVESAIGTPTLLMLQNKGLAHSFDRASVTISGNVVRATHGETVEEFAGSGDATKVFQKFDLKQKPLTYLRAPAPVLLASTLEVRVDDVLWHKVPFFYQRGPGERIYIERLGETEQTTVHFGDGVTGARLPSGQHNVRLKYRKGSGLEGLVKAGQLTQLLTRPLGVKEVVNPLPAGGADEAESLSDARRNAPLTVRTLERVVSLQDYEDFARAYAGIAKALATWTWDGRSRGVFLTVAGPKGAAVPIGPGSVGSDLLDALRASGDPFVPLRLESYRPAWFEVSGTVTVDRDYEPEKVMASARNAIRSRFSFAAREFGQPVHLSDVMGILHSVEGVVAVDVDHLQRADKTEPDEPAPRLLADFPGAGAGLDISPAELLLLAPGNLLELRTAS